MDTVHGTALIQGASRGIGLEFARQVLARSSDGRVFATCRDPASAPGLERLSSESAGRLTVLRLDVTEEESVASAADAVRQHVDRLGLVVNVAGVLHGRGVSPEKKLGHVEPDALRRVFEVNAFGPLLVAKHFHRFLRHDARSVFASLSARVGSISDNRLGGWYAYRASKAAQNMFTKTISIELQRNAPNAIVVGLHPGTVDTDLSAPFQRGVPKDKLFTTEHSVRSLLSVVDSLGPEDTGKVFDFRGDEILP
jgi:NAD(P)-dependent dehydrogenase (short-subunit alcohol dehydrogenase family)